MDEEPAIGNRDNKPLGGDLKSSIRNGLGVAGIVGEPMALFTTGFGREGRRYHGIASLLMTAVPAWVDGARGPEAGGPSGYGPPISATLVAVWALRKVRAQFNRGHTVEIGATVGCSKVRPFLDLIYGLGIAYAVSTLDDVLGGLAAFSALGNAIGRKAVLERQRMEVVLASDQRRRGGQFGRDLEAYER